MRILHVTEAWAGGIATAIRNSVALLPEWSHSLLYMARPYGPDPASLDVSFDRITRLKPTSMSPFLLARAVEAEDFDVVHLHSSLAGAYVRLLNLRTSRTRIVYSPHCYAFERTDINRSKKQALVGIEGVLSIRSRRIFCVSPFEASTARRLNSRSKVHYIPHPIELLEEPAQCRALGHAITIGRISPQKDPLYFLNMVREYRRYTHRKSQIQWTWIGDGEPATRDLLVAEGVRVTGWLPSGDVHELLTSADLYVHTAAWEGAPLTVYEAAAAGLPICARSIPSLESLGVPCLHNSPSDMARAIADGRIDWPAQMTWRKRIRSENSRTNVSQILTDAYTRA
jgi:glycosyltransferase involved in cell wall biosynthesis